MRYIGSKDKLLPAIHALLYDKGLLNQRLRFFDAFCGTGAVANSLKNQYDLIINDSMNWSVLYTRGRIMGQSCSFSSLGFDPFEYFRENQVSAKGFFYTNYSPAGSDRMYFTSENAGRIDYIRKTIEDWRLKGKLTINEYSYLIYCLIEGISSVSNTAGVYGAFLKHWDKRAYKAIQFLRVSENLFNAVDEDYPLISTCQRIEDEIGDIDCDILYLDPPYTQNQYGTQYHLLETLVLNDEPELSKVTGSRPVTPMKSYWSKDIFSQVLLDKVVAETRARYIIMSYNNDGFMSKEYIESIFKRYGIPETYECIEIDYKKYNNFKCREQSGHCEYLFFVEKRPISQVVYESPLNYSGNKAKMVNYIRNLLPNNIDIFVDAFGGGFNVGINIAAQRVVYNDINEFVVGLIKSFKDTDTVDYFKALNKVIRQYNLAPNNKEEYLRLRKDYNSCKKPDRSPVLLYALILFGFQQQIRFNGSHEFNIPCGCRRLNDKIVGKFISFARRIKALNIDFYCQSVFDMNWEITPNMVFYFDPPYRETTATYNDGKRGFEGWTIEHEGRLCDLMDQIHQHNAKFVFSYVLETDGFYNHDIQNWATTRGYNIHHVTDTQGRYNNRHEVIITNY